MAFLSLLVSGAVIFAMVRRSFPASLMPIGWKPAPWSVNLVSAVGWPRYFRAALALCAPFVEEFLFRGALLETRGYLPANFLIALLGVATLLARQYSGSLVPPICLHAAYNVVIVWGVTT